MPKYQRGWSPLGHLSVAQSPSPPASTPPLISCLPMEPIRTAQRTASGSSISPLSVFFYCHIYTNNSYVILCVYTWFVIHSPREKSNRTSSRYLRLSRICFSFYHHYNEKVIHFFFIDPDSNMIMLHCFSFFRKWSCYIVICC